FIERRHERSVRSTVQYPFVVQSDVSEQSKSSLRDRVRLVIELPARDRSKHAEPGTLYAGLAQLFRLLRNARSADLPYPLGPVATSGCFVAAVEDPTPSPSRADGTGGVSAAGE